MLIRALYIGATRGLLRVILSFLAAFLAAGLSYLLSNQIVALGADYGITSPRVSLSLAFIGFVFVIYLIGWLGTKAVGFVGLGIPNKILGMLFSVMQLLILAGGALYVLTSILNYFEIPLPGLVSSSFFFRTLQEIKGSF